jgi:hypothetical protein
VTIHESSEDDVYIYDHKPIVNSTPKLKQASPKPTPVKQTPDPISATVSFKKITKVKIKRDPTNKYMNTP